jgi:hypothetical protein
MYVCGSRGDDGVTLLYGEGVLHGDPFLDNVLAHASGDFR